MANAKHLMILKKGVEAWNKWRVNRRQVKPNLCNTDLSGADFFWANLSDADLSEAILSKANLNYADLRGAIRDVRICCLRVFDDSIIREYASGVFMKSRF